MAQRPEIRDMSELDSNRKPYGNYTVLCNGRFLLHPLRPWWWLLEFYTVVGLCVFIYEWRLYDTVIFAGGIFLGLLSLLASFTATFSDPGVMPKPPLKIAIQNDIEANAISSNSGSRTVQKQVPAKGKIDTMETHYYCRRCHHFRPPRCIHCEICDCCIKDLDHHCPVYGGCVGRKTKFSFHTMVFAVPFFWIYLLVNSAFNVVGNSKVQDRFPYYPWTLFCVLIGIFGALIVPPFLSIFPSIDRVHQNVKPSTTSSLTLAAPLINFSQEPGDPQHQPHPISTSEQKTSNEYENIQKHAQLHQSINHIV